MTEAMSPWWDRGRHADRRGWLLARNGIKSALRAWFEGQGFVEVESAQLQASPGNEVHLHGFKTERLLPDGSAETVYLHTSPEFAAKKLLAAGETAIFDFARVFRNREATSPLHANEFTMLEWYRVGADWRALADDTLQLARLALEVTGQSAWTYRDQPVHIEADPIWLTLREAFEYFAGIDLLACMDGDGAPNLAAFGDQARRAGLKANPSASWNDLFNEVLVARVEPAIANIGVPIILHDYPRPEAALARAKPDDPRFADRFELYLCGVELANGFGELNDPIEQRARFEAAMAEQQRLFGTSLPIDEDLLAALAIMPEASGVALGFERLVMLATGARSVDQVRWTP